MFDKTCWGVMLEHAYMLQAQANPAQPAAAATAAQQQHIYPPPADSDFYAGSTHSCMLSNLCTILCLHLCTCWHTPTYVQVTPMCTSLHACDTLCEVGTASKRYAALHCMPCRLHVNSACMLCCLHQVCKLCRLVY